MTGPLQDRQSSAPREMSEAVKMHYQDAGDYLRFVKRQGWQITNYVLMSLFAVFVVHKELHPAKPVENYGLMALATVATLLGLFYLRSIHNAARDLRRKLRHIHEDYFTAEERARLLIDNGPQRAYPGPAFTFTFVGIIVTGWAILLYLLLRS
ncbi:hypothetical protein [Aestuariispira ectoiniformans]|uniref:hypothetical protein n=1 Tax=Aestuariispira ectoiniformans TaxID=2775080 RepID=UPI00223ABB7A|nr:hypothetical protein [Aestuariispira ectoiniformans]